MIRQLIKSFNYCLLYTSKYKIIEPQHYQQIQARYHINSLLAKVIESRQYDEKTLKEMMNPRLIYHDFSLFEEADMTLERIHEAIEQHEKICIYGDYDCDGILATTILVQAFLELGVKVGYHIPHRFEDGYGLNVRRVEQMAEKMCIRDRHEDGDHIQDIAPLSIIPSQYLSEETLQKD